LDGAGKHLDGVGKHLDGVGKLPTFSAVADFSGNYMYSLVVDRLVFENVGELHCCV